MISRQNWGKEFHHRVQAQIIRGVKYMSLIRNTEARIKSLPMLKNIIFVCVKDDLVFGLFNMWFLLKKAKIKRA